MKEKIINIIYKELSYIYCWDCRYNDNEDFCENCYRRFFNINWGISKSTAEGIADKIIKELEK